MTTGVLFVPDSGNKKIGGSAKVSATYVSIARSCPKDCALQEGNLCYAKGGRVGFTSRRLDVEAGDSTPEQLATAEARAIDESFKGGPIPQDGARGGRDLRVHVSGDARTKTAAKILSAAAGRWLGRGGGQPWGYSHAGTRVPRAAWGRVSMLASIDRLDQLPTVRANGYAPARYVAAFPNGDKSWMEAGIRWLPCPQQTRDIACTDCRLCMDDSKLRAIGAGIAFSAHGRSEKKLRLKVLGQ